MAVRIGARQGHVPHIRVEIKTLRIDKLSIRDRFFLGTPIGAEEPAHGTGVVPCPEVVVAGFGISFFAGEMRKRNKRSSPGPSLAMRNEQNTGVTFAKFDDRNSTDIVSLGHGSLDCPYSQRERRAEWLFLSDCLLAKNWDEHRFRDSRRRAFIRRKAVLWDVANRAWDRVLGSHGPGDCDNQQKQRCYILHDNLPAYCGLLVGCWIIVVVFVDGL